MIDEIVYLDHMGKNRFSKTLKIFLSETTRLIALKFCIGLSSRYFFFFVQIMPSGPQIIPPLGSHILHRPLVGLQSVIVVLPDHTHLFFLKWET